MKGCPILNSMMLGLIIGFVIIGYPKDKLCDKSINKVLFNIMIIKKISASNKEIKDK
jgi:hypothetical protein